MPRVQVNGVDLQVSRFRSGADGARPLIVGIHGLGIVDNSSLAFTLGLPLALTFDVLLYDLRGHGRSQLVDSGFGVDVHVKDVIALLDTLEIDEPVHLLGGSYGGAIALTAAVEHPDRVASLSLVDPSVPGPGWGERMAGVLEQFVEGLNGEDPETQVMEALNSRARRRAASLVTRGRKLLFETSFIDEVRRDAPLALEDYRRIACPVLAVYGDNSQIYDMKETLGELVADCEFVILPDADHVDTFHRAESREAITAFVQRVEAQRRATTGS